MEITKDIKVELTEYDYYNQISIIYYNDSTNNDTNSFVMYSNGNNEDSNIIKMVNYNYAYYAKIKIEKNRDFYFSVIADRFLDNSEDYHIYLGESSDKCYIVQNDSTLSENEAIPEEKAHDIFDEELSGSFEDIVDIENLEDIEVFEDTTNEKALVAVNNTKIQNVGKRNHLRFSYKLNKRIRILLIKLYRLMPSFITGNYRRRINL